jgi:dihydroflavonol-4-reductase
MQPKILVTDANGFGESYFARYHAERQIPTRAMYYPPNGAPDYASAHLEIVPGDLLVRASLRRALDGTDIVQNIGALYRPTNVPEKLYWEVNVEGMRNVIQEAAQAGVKWFVQSSTMGVHGIVEHPPGSEDSPIDRDDYYQLT